MNNLCFPVDKDSASIGDGAGSQLNERFPLCKICASNGYPHSASKAEVNIKSLGSRKERSQQKLTVLKPELLLKVLRSQYYKYWYYSVDKRHAAVIVRNYD